MTKRKLKPKLTITDCDKLWAKLIKLRAGNKSELSGKTDRLNAHHLAGKPNYWLRYMELDNGFSCTAGEHIFGFHNAGRAESYRNRVKGLRGSDIYERLEQVKQRNEKISLTEVKEFLESEIQKYE